MTNKREGTVDDLAKLHGVLTRVYDKALQAIHDTGGPPSKEDLALLKEIRAFLNDNGIEAADATVEEGDPTLAKLAKRLAEGIEEDMDYDTQH
jgi:hypothetical protein